MNLLDTSADKESEVTKGIEKEIGRSTRNGYRFTTTQRVRRSVDALQSMAYRCLSALLVERMERATS